MADLTLAFENGGGELPFRETGANSGSAEHPGIKTPAECGEAPS
jgi:hypothetical protein